MPRAGCVKCYSPILGQSLGSISSLLSNIGSIPKDPSLQGL